MSLDDRTVYARQHVDVANSDVDGGTLTFLPPVDVAGKVRVEGVAPGGLSKFRIHLEPQLQYPVPGNHDFPVGTDGSFSITGVMPAVYDIGITRETGFYVRELRTGDKVLANRSIDLASKMEPLVVVLGADAGEVEGTVHNAKDDAVARARVNVIAYGAQSSHTDFNRFGFTDEKGDFKIKDVPPGEYKVFAWEDVPVGAPQDPEFRKPFEKQAAALTMHPHGHEKVQVTAISADQVGRSSQ
jgi:hypothetical protein